jgi:hypothetical protein
MRNFSRSISEIVRAVVSSRANGPSFHPLEAFSIWMCPVSNLMRLHGVSLPGCIQNQLIEAALETCCALTFNYLVSQFSGTKVSIRRNPFAKRWLCVNFSAEIRRWCEGTSMRNSLLGRPARRRHGRITRIRGRPIVPPRLRKGGAEMPHEPGRLPDGPRWLCSSV